MATKWRSIYGAEVSFIFCAALLLFHFTGNLALPSALTWLALLISALAPFPGRGAISSLAALVLFIIVFFAISIVPGFDDFNPLGHWINTGRIANGDWPPSNSIIPDLPLGYHWGIDALAAFLKVPFGHHMSVPLSLALAQNIVWVTQIRLILMLLRLGSRFSYIFFDAAAVLAVVGGTQWIFLTVFANSPSDYLWTNETRIGGYRIIDSVLAFQVHQRGFGLAFCIALSIALVFGQFSRSIGTKKGALLGLLLGLLLAAMNIAHAVMFGVTALSVAILSVVFAACEIARDPRLRTLVLASVTGLCMAAPIMSVLTSAGMLAGVGESEIGLIIKWASFGYPRNGDGGYGAFLFWASWFGLLIGPVIALALAPNHNCTGLKEAALLLLIMAFIAFFMLSRFDHPNGWDGSKFLIAGTFPLTLLIMMLSRRLLSLPRNFALKSVVAVSLLLNCIAIGRQMVMFHRSSPPDVFPAMLAAEPQPEQIYSAADALMIPDDISNGRAPTWLAATFGMRQALKYPYFYQYPIPLEKDRQYLALIDQAIALDATAINSMGIKVITFSDTANTRPQQLRIESLGFKRCGDVAGSSSAWPLWCRN